MLAARWAAAHESSPLVGASSDSGRLFSSLSHLTKVVVVLLLLVSLVTNILVLMDWCIFIYLYADPEALATLMHAGPFSIWHTIDLLKQFNMTGLVIILIAFSICFPFVKLLWVAWLMVWPTTQRFRSCQIKWLGQLGRWSLLDIYVALIILMMITDQQNLHIQVAFIQIPAGLSADVGAGMLLFPLAILCSIAAVAILELAIDPIRYTPHEPRPPTLLCADAVVSGGTCVLSALMGLVATFVAFFSPLFTIKQLSPNVLNNDESGAAIALFGDQLLHVLRPNTWSVWSALVALMSDDVGDGSPTLTFFMLLMIALNILAPCALFGALLWLQCVPRDHVSLASFRLACFISTLCLPEVLFFAYVLTLVAIAPQLIEVDTGLAFAGLCVYMAAVPLGLVSAHYSMQAAQLGAKKQPLGTV